MYFVGLDLAWGAKNPSGIAVLDDSGALVTIAAARTNDEIVELLRPFSIDGVLVAIDAPLVVKNDAGNRQAEKDLNKDFARFQAGAHPTNTNIASLRDGLRGETVSALLRLDLDPDSRSARRAIEVYPHAATVAIFRLGGTLKYKNKPGRTFAQLRSELLTLIRLLEGLTAANPALHLVGNAAWRELVVTVEQAAKKSQLRHAEDQIDAVVCAYVALFRERRPADVTTYGSFAEGYILSPTLPSGLKPSPRPPKVAKAVDVVNQATRAYAAQLGALQQAAGEAIAMVTSILDDAGLNYLSVTGRAKSVASFAEKAARSVDGVPVFTDPLTQIGDVLGIRVITYVHSDVASVAGLLADEAEVLDDRDMGEDTAREGRFGYASRHLQIRLKADDRTQYPRIGERQVQVQIRTVLQHAWAEFEHDIRYKGVVPEQHRSDFDRRFSLAAGLLELADHEFSVIRATLSGTVTGIDGRGPDTDPRISPQELGAFLAGQYAEASWSRPDHYAWISGLLLELGITSLSELADAVRPIDTAAIDASMGYRQPAGAVRRLDDVLLKAYGDQYVALHGNAHRRDRLRDRLIRMTS